MTSSRRSTLNEIRELTMCLNESKRAIALGVTYETHNVAPAKSYCLLMMVGHLAEFNVKTVFQTRTATATVEMLRAHLWGLEVEEVVAATKTGAWETMARTAMSPTA